MSFCLIEVDIKVKIGYNINKLFGFLELDIYFKFYATFSPARVKVVFCFKLLLEVSLVVLKYYFGYTL